MTQLYCRYTHMQWQESWIFNWFCNVFVRSTTSGALGSPGGTSSRAAQQPVA